MNNSYFNQDTTLPIIEALAIIQDIESMETATILGNTITLPSGIILTWEKWGNSEKIKITSSSTNIELDFFLYNAQAQAAIQRLFTLPSPKADKVEDEKAPAYQTEMIYCPLIEGTVTEQKLIVKKIGNSIPCKKVITSAIDGYNVFRAIWDKEETVETYECFYLLILNRANQPIAYVKIGQGGIAATSVDYALIFQNIWSVNGSAFMVAHNHPSGNLNPSPADISLTSEIKAIAKIHNIQFLDHLILTSTTFFSFANEGMMR